MNNKKPKITFLTGWGFKNSIWSQIIPITSPWAILGRSGGKGILIAWSLGGLYAINLAHRFPDKYQKIIFISSLPKFVSDEKTQWYGIPVKQSLKIYQQSKNNLLTLMNDFLGWVLYPDKNINLINIVKKYVLDINNPHHQIYLKKSLKLLFQADYRKQYQNLTQELFHIFGDHDAIIPVRAVSQLDGKIFVIPGAGHISFLTHKEKFNKIFQKILYE